ncbi:MAG: hypothetical protein WBP13_03940 [Methylophilaceae bacterium]
MKPIISMLMLLQLILLSGCAETAYQTAQTQANEASKSKPIDVAINAPFNANDAKAALAPGNLTINGVMYSRLNITGRDDLTWPQSPLVKNRPFVNMPVYLYPATPYVEEYAKQLNEQDKKVKSFWLGNPNKYFNPKPQAKNIIFSNEAAKYRLVTKTDNFGRYSFKNIKPGKYYIYCEGNIYGTYNKEVYAGSSTYSDGTGIYGEHGSIDHTRLEPVNYKTYIMYLEATTITESKTTAPIDSRLRVNYNEMSIAYPD